MEAKISELELFKKDNFDEVFKAQIAESAHFKQVSADKDELISRLQDELFSKDKQIETMITDAHSSKLLLMAELKQEQQKAEIQLSNKENELKTLKNCLRNLEGKLQVVIGDVKMKDDFIQQYLMGRTKSSEEQEHVRGILEEYRIIFPINKITDKLLQEEREIERLTEKLLKY